MILPVRVDKIAEIFTDNLFSRISEVVKPRLVNLYKTAIFIKRLVAEWSFFVELPKMIIFGLKEELFFFQFSNPILEKGQVWGSLFIRSLM